MQFASTQKRAATWISIAALAMLILWLLAPVLTPLFDRLSEGLKPLLACVAGLLQFASFKALVMVAAVYGTGQVVEGFYLTPRLVASAPKLHGQPPAPGIQDENSEHA